MTTLAQEVVFTPEQIKPLKAMMMDKNFYVSELKSTLKAVNKEVFMSRVGNSCSDEFVKLMSKQDCADATR